MIFFVAEETLYSLDPVQFLAEFPIIHSFEKPPFYQVPPKATDATVGGMPYCNALFSILWYNAFIKFVNMAPFICPTQHENSDVIFERKIPIPDGGPSDECFINEYLIDSALITVWHGVLAEPPAKPCGGVKGLVVSIATALILAAAIALSPSDFSP
jgi:hypothetical protein